MSNRVFRRCASLTGKFFSSANTFNLHLNLAFWLKGKNPWETIIFYFTGPLLPGDLDVDNIPQEQIRELTINLSGKSY